MNQLLICVGSSPVSEPKHLFSSSVGYGHTTFSRHHVLRKSVAAEGSLPFLRFFKNSSFSVRMEAAYLRFRVSRSVSEEWAPRAEGPKGSGHFSERGRVAGAGAGAAPATGKRVARAFFSSSSSRSVSRPSFATRASNAAHASSASRYVARRSSA